MRRGVLSSILQVMKSKPTWTNIPADHSNRTDESAPRMELAPGTGLVGAVFKAWGRDVPVYAFKGIPYAQPPVGELRFGPPRPVKLWKGERQATDYGPMCIQDTSINHKLPWQLHIPDKMSEDCLFLNVWTPTLDPGARKPVMVWIHGGAFMSGWSNAYEGTAICSYEDVVFVSINYRCGIFGFLCTGDDVAPGNNGLWDQIEALRWVQKYIHRFGGDPNNVTLWGESAGGASVSVLMLSDQAVGLFHKAISQSGTVHMPGMLWSQRYAKEKLIPILQRMGLESTKSEDILSFLQNQTADFIQKHFIITDTFHPVIDNIIVRKECVINQDSNQIPYIIGCNSCEGALFVHLFMDFNIHDMRACQMAIMIFLALTFDLAHLDVPEVTAALMKEYFEGASNEDLIKRVTEMIGDAWFVYPTSVGADAHAGMIYKYYLTLTPSATKYPEWVSADHATDVGLALGCPLYDYSHHAPDWTYTEQEAHLSRNIMKYWANFARTGDPNGSGLPFWPNHALTDKSYLMLDKQISTRKDIKPKRIAFWKDLMAVNCAPFTS